MTTVTKSPTQVRQDTGGAFRKFDHLANIKNTNPGNYAISDGAITGKTGSKNTPAWLILENFKFGMPSNAVVKKIVVKYNYAKRGANSSGQPVKKDYPNFPKTHIHLGSGNKTIANGYMVSPPKEGSLKTVTFKGLWNASDINSLWMNVEFGANTTNKDGFVLISYIQVSVEYYTPQYSVKGASANTSTVYNGDEYHLKVSVSDSNKTKRVPECTIQVPSGLTFKSAKGGNATSTGNNTVKFIPDMKSGTGSVELIFDTAFTFSSGQSSKSFTFYMQLSNTATPVTGTSNGIVYKELPKTEEEGGDDTYTEMESTEDEAIQPIDKAKVGESIYIDVIATLYNTTHGTFSVYLNNPSKTTGTTEDVWNNFTFKIDGDTVTPSSNKLTLPGNKFHGEGSVTSPMTCTLEVIPNAPLLSQFNIEHKYYDVDTTSWKITDYAEFKYLIIPQESSLTIPHGAILQPTSEETGRLGDGYHYNAQSDLELVTSETYLRDWYKNFRVGVFNNPILANLSTYYQYDNTAEEFDGYFYIPGGYDLTGASLVVTADHSIKLNDETVSTKTYSSLTDYNMPITFEKVSNDNVILSLTLKDSSNNTLWTMDYHVNFNAETDNFEEVTVDSTDYTSLTDAQIISNAFYWSDDTAGLNEYNSVVTGFTYDKNYPIYIIITGDYPEGDPSDNEILFNEPCIIESDVFSTRLENGNYPVPIDNLVINTDSSEISIESNDTSNTVVFYDLPLDEGYGTDTTRAIRGIELTGSLEQADRCILYAKLKSPTGESHERSIVVNDYDTTLDTDNSFTIGGNGDLWGFNTLDMVDLDRWEIEFSIANTLDNLPVNLNMKDVTLNIYVEEVEQQNVQIKVENEDIAYYGAFITDLTVPEGLETDTDYLKVDGTDTNDAYRQNIKEKTITIEFEIDGCDLEASTLSLRELTRLLVNDRDEYNRPIPKRLEISNYPDVYWEYIMESPLDTSIEISSYKCKAKLTIPAGTSYDKNSTTTASTGYVDGLAAINPVIIVKPTDEIVTITETITGQSFTIGNSNWGDNILEVDCENRTAYLKANEEDDDPINVNEYVDYDSDWIRLRGEYAFEGTNCVIRTIEYGERW